MIAIAARNLYLSSFISKSNVYTSPPLSTLCRSSLYTLSSLLYRSFVSLPTPTPTSDPDPPSATRRRKRRRKKESVFDPAVYDVLVNKHKFSPNVASFVASALTRSRSEVKCDSVLTFLEESGFSSTQLEKVVKHRPRFLTAGFEEEIRSKIKAFQEGFSPDEIAKITTGNVVVLQVTLKNRLVPSMSIARKNLSSSFFSNPNRIFSFLCNPNLLSIHHFSTAKLRRRLITTPSPGIYDLLFQKHQFSSEFASSIASAHLTKSSTPERADSVLSFLKENSFTNSQLEKILRYKPVILGYNVEGLQLKLGVFRDLGLSSEEVAKMMVGNLSILYSNDEVARLLRKPGSGWFVTNDLNKTLMPNVQILNSSGTSMERVLHFLHIDPRCLLIKPDIMKKSVDKAIEFGVPQASTSFIHAVSVFAHTTQEMWEAKLQTLRDLGFSDLEILSMFRRIPTILSQSQKKLKSAVELLVGTGKYNIPDIVKYPASLGYSIEKRLEPRLDIFVLLESKNLIERRPSLAILCQYNDARFSDQFVKPYFDEECLTKK